MVYINCLQFVWQIATKNAVRKHTGLPSQKDLHRYCSGSNTPEYPVPVHPATLSLLSTVVVPHFLWHTWIIYTMLITHLAHCPTLSPLPWVKTYHMQANQCAIRANVAIKSTSTAAPYSEYRSIFRATRTRRSNRAVFNSPIKVVVCKREINCTLNRTYSVLLWAVTKLD